MSAPIDVFDSIFFKQIHFYQKCCGSDVLTKDFRPHKWTVFFCSMDFSFMLFNCYTLATYDTTTKLKCLAIIGLGFQGFAKFPTVIFHSSTLYDMVAFLRSIYLRNCLYTLPAHNILLRWARLMDRVMRVGAVVTIAAALLYIPESVLESAQAGHRVPMLNSMVPGVNIDGEGNWPNYAGVYVYHTILVFLGGFGTCAMDMLLVMLVMHMCPLAAMFERTLEDLNRALDQSPNVLEGSNIDWFFRNFLLMHKEITEYLEIISKIYYYIFLVEIYSDALSLCALIVCFIQIQWIAVYPLFMLFLVKLFAYCFLGTIAELSTDRIYAALMTCDWMKLSTVQKHHFRLMLLFAQKPAVLMAGTVTLNLDTFVNMLKTVYTVGMILIETLK